MNRTIFSGIQPSGNLHIGNYIGAMSQWVKLQNDQVLQNELIFCIVDLHAITVPQDPKELREKIIEVAVLYIACGIDPKKSHIFVQSENPDHSYLAWIFNCITPFGWMERMTQFKDKSAKLKAQSSTQENISVGLFNYPALMAADILLYDTDLVPVGEDQKQHIELTRDIADRFNRQYDEVFKLPEPMIDKSAARIMSLANPMSKMSKSDRDPAGTINLLDNPDEVVKKIKRAVTDSGTDIMYSDDKPALSNLLTIYAQLVNVPIDHLVEKYKGRGYGEFKTDLAEVVVNFLTPLQEKFKNLTADKDNLQKVLDEGRDFARDRSSKKVNQVRSAVGLGR